MPNSPDIAEPDRNHVQSPPTITLPGADVTIPRDYDEVLLTRLEGEGRYAHTRISVHVADDGEPILVDFRFTPPRGGLRADELRRPDLAGLLRWAHVQRCAKAQMTARAEEAGGVVVLEDDEVEAIYDVARTIGRKRGPYRITDDFLSGVLAHERTGGVKLVAKENDTSERTARRWIREARERGLR